MKVFFKCIVIALIALTTHPLSAQIISSGHTASIPTNYPSHSGIDSIYFYSGLNTGALTAMPLAGANITYTWYKLEGTAWVEKSSGNTPDYNFALEETGYQIRITDNNNPAGQYQCWVAIPQIETAEADTILNTCISLQLSTKNPIPKPLTYYDLSTFTAISIEYQYSYIWHSTPDGDINGSTKAQPIIDAPVDSATYWVDISAFNTTPLTSDEFKFAPIAVKADFTFDATDRGHINEYPKNDEFTDITSFTGSALITISINNKSKGSINRYIWEVYDIDGNLYTDDIGPNPTTFEFPELGTYNINLEVVNTLRSCKSSVQHGPIIVSDMEVDVPNVFTPDGDGINDKFMVVYTSVKEFKMVILNRWGRKVFQTTNPGESWDGKIGNSKAAAGVYFYYIDAKGYNKGEHIKLDGPVHLIRGN